MWLCFLRLDGLLRRNYSHKTGNISATDTKDQVVEIKPLIIQILQSKLLFYNGQSKKKRERLCREI